LVVSSCSLMVDDGSFSSNGLCFCAVAIVCSGSFEDDHERFTLWSSYYFIVYGRRALKHTHRSPALPLDADSIDGNGHLRGRGRSHSHGFEDSSDTLPSTDAHGDQRILASDAAQFVEGLDCQDAARRPDGVTKRNPTAVRVGAI
jgi:hypothetical protein